MENNMITVDLPERVQCQTIGLFEPSKNQMKYQLISKTGKTGISFDCVERYSDVEPNQSFKTLILYDVMPMINLPSILSMEVKFMSINSSGEGNQFSYTFEGCKRPYSVVSMYSETELFPNCGQMIGNSYFIGIK